MVLKSIFVWVVGWKSSGFGFIYCAITQQKELEIKAETYVHHIEIYRNDVRVVRRRYQQEAVEKRPFFCMDVDGTVITNQSLTREITEFSRRSQKNLAFVVSNTDCYFDRMVTLTYPNEFPKDGKIIKAQLNTFLMFLRREGITAYLWFLEFQKRGAPHFHILMQGGKYIDRNKVADRWFRVVNSGDIKHLHAGTKIERGRKKGGLHRYAVKYAQKLYQKHVPTDFENVGRFWGCSRNVYPSEAYTLKVETEKDLTMLLKHWDYLGKESEGYSILFNASQPVLQLLFELGMDVNSVSV